MKARVGQPNGYDGECCEHVDVDRHHSGRARRAGKGNTTRNVGQDGYTMEDRDGALHGQMTSITAL